MNSYSDRVYVDTTTVFHALKIPHPFYLYGIPFTTVVAISWVITFGKFDSGMFLFAYTSYGPMYLDRTMATSESVETQIFELRGVDGGSSTFDIDYGFIKDDRVPQITWSNASKNAATYETGHSGGCGQGYPEIVPFSAANGKIFQVGTTSAEDPCMICGSQSPIIKGSTTVPMVLFIRMIKMSDSNTERCLW